eukprot:TRINITY_DN6047_c0_g1_i3.p1 TRINITY_DN6047_c0_g1~~TRINITY_DN6047_c0_g1_i3.p1  ORF type:complete len:869 (+),score=161.68 TRINITY_DN6047_c0_g1_i3:379-2607(+)
MAVDEPEGIMMWSCSTDLADSTVEKRQLVYRCYFKKSPAKVEQVDFNTPGLRGGVAVDHASHQAFVAIHIGNGWKVETAPLHGCLEYIDPAVCGKHKHEGCSWTNRCERTGAGDTAVVKKTDFKPGGGIAATHGIVELSYSLGNDDAGLVKTKQDGSGRLETLQQLTDMWMSDSLTDTEGFLIGHPVSTHDYEPDEKVYLSAVAQNKARIYRVDPLDANPPELALELTDAPWRATGTPGITETRNKDGAPQPAFALLWEQKDIIYSTGSKLVRVSTDNPGATKDLLTASPGMKTLGPLTWYPHPGGTDAPTAAPASPSTPPSAVPTIAPRPSPSAAPKDADQGSAAGSGAGSTPDGGGSAASGSQAPATGGGSGDVPTTSGGGSDTGSSNATAGEGSAAAGSGGAAAGSGGTAAGSGSAATGGGGDEGSGAATTGSGGANDGSTAGAASNADEQTEGDSTPLVLVIVAVVLLGCAAAVFFVWYKRSKPKPIPPEEHDAAVEVSQTFSGKTPTTSSPEPHAAPLSQIFLEAMPLESDELRKCNVGRKYKETALAHLKQMRTGHHDDEHEADAEHAPAARAAEEAGAPHVAERQAAVDRMQTVLLARLTGGEVEDALDQWVEKQWEGGGQDDHHAPLRPPVAGMQSGRGVHSVRKKTFFHEQQSPRGTPATPHMQGNFASGRGSGRAARVPVYAPVGQATHSQTSSGTGETWGIQSTAPPRRVSRHSPHLAAPQSPKRNGVGSI